MNFIIWLLKRVKRKIFGVPGSPTLCSKYRDFMRDEFFGALILTVLFGFLQFMVGGILAVWICDSRPPQLVFYVLLANPVIFFFYNWLTVLYEVYDAERMATWHRLKE
jgi:TM2 domain-containing membrane protein YozV